MASESSPRNVYSPIISKTFDKIRMKAPIVFEFEKCFVSSRLAFTFTLTLTQHFIRCVNFQRKSEKEDACLFGWMYRLHLFLVHGKMIICYSLSRSPVNTENMSQINLFQFVSLCT